MRVVVHTTHAGRFVSADEDATAEQIAELKAFVRDLLKSSSGGYISVTDEDGNEVFFQKCWIVAVKVIA